MVLEQQQQQQQQEEEQQMNNQENQQIIENFQKQAQNLFIQSLSFIQDIVLLKNHNDKRLEYNTNQLNNGIENRDDSFQFYASYSKKLMKNLIIYSIETINQQQNKEHFTQIETFIFYLLKTEFYKKNKFQQLLSTYFLKTLLSYLDSEYLDSIIDLTQQNSEFQQTKGIIFQVIFKEGDIQIQQKIIELIKEQKLNLPQQSEFFSLFSPFSIYELFDFKIINGNGGQIDQKLLEQDNLTIYDEQILQQLVQYTFNDIYTLLSVPNITEQSFFTQENYKAISKIVKIMINNGLFFGFREFQQEYEHITQIHQQFQQQQIENEEISITIKLNLYELRFLMIKQQPLNQANFMLLLEIYHELGEYLISYFQAQVLMLQIARYMSHYTIDDPNDKEQISQYLSDNVKQFFNQITCQQSDELLEFLGVIGIATFGSHESVQNLEEYLGDQLQNLFVQFFSGEIKSHQQLKTMLKEQQEKEDKNAVQNEQYQILWKLFQIEEKFVQMAQEVKKQVIEEEDTGVKTRLNAHITNLYFSLKE